MLTQVRPEYKQVIISSVLSSMKESYKYGSAQTQNSFVLLRFFIARLAIVVILSHNFKKGRDSLKEEMRMAMFKLFDGLKKSETARIFDLGMIWPVEEGRILFHKGDIGHEMYVLLTGKIQIVDESLEGETRLAELRPGELFGEMAMFETSHTRSAAAVAMENSQLLVLSEDILAKFLEKKVPRKFLANIIAVLCQRLRVTNSMYLESKYGSTDSPET